MNERRRASHRGKMMIIIILRPHTKDKKTIAVDIIYRMSVHTFAALDWKIMYNWFSFPEDDDDMRLISPFGAWRVCLSLDAYVCCWSARARTLTREDRMGDCHSSLNVNTINADFIINLKQLVITGDLRRARKADARRLVSTQQTIPNGTTWFRSNESLTDQRCTWQPSLSN
jgi:hypothetical protein